MNLNLIPADSRLEVNGDGPSFDISASATRTFLCRLTVSDQIEQESLDVSIWGSSDGETWTKKPLLKLPQQWFFRPGFPIGGPPDRNIEGFLLNLVGDGKTAEKCARGACGNVESRAVTIGLEARVS